MPPKKPQPPPKAKKAVEDKTFGMKNKKGGAAQRTIRQLETQQKNNKTLSEKQKEAEKLHREKEKAAADEARREAAALFNVQVQKVPFGVDPKTIVCQFWKRGNCEKGKKCKFAHDLSVERKSEKKSLYNDEEEKKKEDDMANWDEEKLREVVNSKHGNPRTTTDKVCKFFIDAVENSKYGWFWQCPNGGEKCMYRHTLPPGFVYKTREQRMAEKEHNEKLEKNGLTLEDWLESERYKIAAAHGGKITPVTEETFKKWKKERVDKKQAEEEARRAKEATGRMLFEQGGWRVDDLDADSDSDGDDDDDDGVLWNLAALRKETEAARQRLEQERLDQAYKGGGGGLDGGGNGDAGDDDLAEGGGAEEESAPAEDKQAEEEQST